MRPTERSYAPLLPRGAFDRRDVVEASSLLPAGEYSDLYQERLAKFFLNFERFFAPDLNLDDLR